MKKQARGFSSGMVHRDAYAANNDIDGQQQEAGSGQYNIIDHEYDLSLIHI